MIDTDSPNFAEAYRNGYFVRDGSGVQANISWWHGTGGTSRAFLHSHLAVRGQVHAHLCPHGSIFGQACWITASLRLFRGGTRKWMAC